MTAGDTSVICKLPASPKAAGQDSDRKVGEGGMDGGSPTTRHGSAGETSRSGLLGRGPNGGLSASTSRADIWGVSTDLEPGTDGISAPGTTSGRGEELASPSKMGSLRRRLQQAELSRGAGDASPTKPHPLSRPGRPRDGQCNETQDSIADEDIFGPASPPDSVTRPALKRFTSETEKRLEDAGWSGLGSYGSGSGYGREPSDAGRSGRDSVDQARGSSLGGEEVEVLVHHIKAGESLAGIALLYGINLPLLRKTNKLWPSDPVHLRTHLYVPLEACRWNKARETFKRGPGEGQITLTAKVVKVPSDQARSSPPNGKHNGAEPETMDNSPVALETDPWPMSPSLEDPWSGEPVVNLASPPRKVDPPPAPESRTGSSSPASAPRDALPQLEYEQRVLDVVRMPASKLRFFPKSSGTTGGSGFTRHQLPSPRTSMDSDSLFATSTSRRQSLADQSATASSSRRVSSSGQAFDISGAIPVPSRDKSKSGGGNMVKIRPPTHDRRAATSNGRFTLTGRLSQLFVVPPPPMPGTDALGRPLRSRTNGRPTPRMSLDSAKSGTSARSNFSALSGMSTLSNSGDSPRRAGSTNLPGEELEMDVQTPMADSHQYSSPLSRSGSQRDLLDDPFAGFGYSRLAGAKKKMVQGMVNGDVLGRNADGGHRRTSSDTVREAQQRRGSKKLD